MTSLDLIKKRLSALYEKNPEIHISVTLQSPMLHLENEPLCLTGIYPHIFQVLECTGEMPRHPTIPYKDVLTKNVRILELL